MKKLLLICLAMVLCVGVNAAQRKEKSKTTTKVFVTDIDCEGCAVKINNNIPVLGRGIKDVKVDVASKEVTVTYDSAKNDTAKIIAGFKKIDVVAAVKDCDKCTAANHSHCGKCADGKDCDKCTNGNHGDKCSSGHGDNCTSGNGCGECTTGNHNGNHGHSDKCKTCKQK